MFFFHLSPWPPSRNTRLPISKVWPLSEANRVRKEGLAAAGTRGLRSDGFVREFDVDVEGSLKTFIEMQLQVADP